MLKIVHPPGYGPERAYAIRVVVEELLGLECSLEKAWRDDVEITLADGSDGRVLVADGLFSLPESAWLTEAALPLLPLEECDLGGLAARLVSPPLPVLFGGSPAVHGSPGEVSLGLDVFGSAFFLLTRYEEAVVSARDEHERFPASESLALKGGFLGRPLVNEYVEVLWWALERVWPRLARPQRTFRQRPTHDVDIPFCPPRSLPLALRLAAGDAVRRRDPALSARRFASFVETKLGRHGSDPCNRFEFLLAQNERYGLRSAFYFLAGGTAPLDGTYSLDDPWIRRLLRRVHERGHEIGLHPSYETLGDPSRLRSELDALRRACAEEGIDQPIAGGRQHYLRWENPATWQDWDDAGLAYDSSLGFADHAGFRCSVCFDYPVFNLRTRRQLSLRERPLVAMDRTLVAYMELRPEELLEEVAELKRRCRLFQGDFTLLWHNSMLVTRRERRLYSDALAL